MSKHSRDKKMKEQKKKKSPAMPLDKNSMAQSGPMKPKA